MEPVSDVRIMMGPVEGIARPNRRLRKDSNVYLATRRAVNNWKAVYLCRGLYIAEGFSG